MPLSLRDSVQVCIQVSVPKTICIAFSASEAISAHKKGLGTPLSSGHKLQSPSKKYEAPGKWNYSALLKRVSIYYWLTAINVILINVSLNTVCCVEFIQWNSNVLLA